jgi:copper transport protein
VIRRKAVVAAAAALGLLLLAAGPASAHAELLSTTPGDGQTVDHAPAEVRLEFSESVSVSLGGVRVFDRAGQRVDRGNSSHGASRRDVRVGLRSGLDDGTYIVTWRVISADSHPVHGGFVFSIGAPTQVRHGLLNKLLDQQGDRSWQAVGAALRAVAYAGLLLAAGGSTVLAWFGGEADRDATRVLLSVAAVVGVVAAAAALPVQAILTTGLGVGAITEPGVFRQVIGEGLGLSVLLAVIGAALLIMSAWSPANATTRAITAIGALVAAGSFAAAGHSRSTDPIWISNIADAAHLWAAATWFGGVVVVALALRRRHRRPDSSLGAARLVVSFSSIAGIALLVVAAAGGVLAWGQVRALRALTSTTYGWVLVVKVGVVALIALAGAYNRYRLVPAIAARQSERGEGAAWMHLRRSVGVEAIGLLVVLGLTGVLVGMTPAKTEAGIGGVTSITTPLGKGTVNLTIDPNRAGRNTIHIYLLDELGRQVDKATDMTLEFSLPSRGLGPITRTPFKAGPGHWQFDGDVLSIPGRWDITITSRVSKFDEDRAVASLKVNP